MSMGNVHTINLGKVMLSQSQHRAARAINMVKEYARRHEGVADVKIDTKLAEIIWARGARRPPRKITVEMVIDDAGAVMVMHYDEVEATAVQVSEPPEPKEESPSVEAAEPESPQLPEAADAQPSPKADAQPSPKAN